MELASGHHSEACEVTPGFFDSFAPLLIDTQG